MGPQKRGVVAPSAGADIVVSGTGRISGVALDAKSGQPLRNFSVSYEPDRGGGMVIRMVARGAGAQTGIGQKREFQTEDGAFALEDVPAGTWTVVLEAKGYQTARVANLAVEEGGTKDGVEVRATPGTVLKGRVSDAKTGPAGRERGRDVGARGIGRPGRACSGAAGRSCSTAARRSRRTPRARSRSRASRAGRVKVTAKSPDYADGSEVADVKEAGGSVEIKLASGGSVGGVVVSGNQPVAGRERLARGGRRGEASGASSAAGRRRRRTRRGASRSTTSARDATARRRA